MKHKTLLMKQIIQKPHDIKTYAEQAEIYSWFLYRSAPAYQNEEFRFLIQPAAKQNKCHRISFQIGCFSSNIKMFLAFHIVQTMLNIKPPKQIFQTYNVFPAEDLAIDIEGCQGHMALPSSNLVKLQFYSIVSRPFGNA